MNENVDDEVKDIFQGNILSDNVSFQILPYSAKESQKNQLSDKLSEKINPLEENNGQALIISNKGCLNILNKKKYKYLILDNMDIFKGTLISLRLNKFEIQNFHDCIFQFGTNPYKLEEVKL